MSALPLSLRRRTGRHVIGSPTAVEQDPEETQAEPVQPTAAPLPGLPPEPQTVPGPETDEPSWMAGGTPLAATAGAGPAPFAPPEPDTVLLPGLGGHPYPVPADDRLVAEAASALLAHDLPEDILHRVHDKLLAMPAVDAPAPRIHAPAPAPDPAAAPEGYLAVGIDGQDPQVVPLGGTPFHTKVARTEDGSPLSEICIGGTRNEPFWLAGNKAWRKAMHAALIEADRAEEAALAAQAQGSVA